MGDFKAQMQEDQEEPRTCKVFLLRGVKYFIFKLNKKQGEQRLITIEYGFENWVMTSSVTFAAAFLFFA